ncbi:major facilitator superfamily domain-containing protein [Microdochium bolleyi]|uniref:Major facilitator superfamily domain-containing protein n=1 Tax=Microdochium bolleyi TaxID=196109 RepID=A0A136ISL4_9PEZI|nr:major facilitator superfamily domain-containing protein [Microdochium bolleyi]
MAIHDPVSHTEDIPGTVDLNFSDGEETALGLALYPVPSQDPNDPLRWSQRKKYLLLFFVSAYSFMANSTLIGASVYVNFLAQLFGKTPNETSRLVTYPNLLFGFGSLLFVPLYHKIGRRPVMLLSLMIYAGGILGCALSNSYDVLLAFRIVHGFGSSVCEALPAQVVADVFFIHERGKALGWYTFALATGSLGALAASYMLAAGLSYNLFFWLSFALAVLLLISTFFGFEETMYFRAEKLAPDTPTTGVSPVSKMAEKEEAAAGEMIETRIPDNETADPVPPRKSYAQQLKPWGPTDPHTAILIMIISLHYVLCDDVRRTNRGLTRAHNDWRSRLDRLHASSGAEVVQFHILCG